MLAASSDFDVSPLRLNYRAISKTMLRAFVPRETIAGESRVAATPETIEKLIGLGLSVTVEAGAGAGAHIDDEAFSASGATLVEEASAAWGEADLVLTVRGADQEQAQRLKQGAILIGLLSPADAAPTAALLAQRQVTSLALELLPRVTRAQSMDALSSQASIAGYKAVLLAAGRLAKYFPLLMTAAGTVKPARVVVMGAGVAGLQAIATAKRLGAVVEVSDIRPAVEEEIKSLGGRFIELPMVESGEGKGGYAKQMGEDFLVRQREIVQKHLAAADVAITTAQIPGRKAPTLITREMVESMRRGAVIVDLAVEQGGNCELSRLDEEVVHQGVLILGPRNLAATMAEDASNLYARNILAVLREMVKVGAEGAENTENTVEIDPENDVLVPMLWTHGGEVTHGPTAEKLAASGAAAQGD